MGLHLGRGFAWPPLFALCTLAATAAGCREATPLFDDSEPDTDSAATTLPTSASTSVGPTTTQTSSASGGTANTGPSSSGSSSSTATDSESSASSSSSTSTAAAGPEIEILIGGSAVQAGESFTFADSQPVGSASNEVALTIRNTGDDDLQITSVALNGSAASHFSTAPAELSTTLAPRASTSLQLVFSPQNGGFKSADVQISSNDSDEGDYAITLLANTTPNTWRLLQTASAPAPRSFGAMASLGDGTILLFGGEDALAGGLGDTWIFAVDAQNWAELDVAEPPSPRFSAGIASTTEGTVVLFGGFSPLGMGLVAGDTWRFSAGTMAWESVSPTTSPSARFDHAMAGGPGFALVYGGGSDPATDLRDVWLFDEAADDWSGVVSNAPGFRRSMGIAADPSGNATLFGGYLSSGPTVLDDTWTYSAVSTMFSEPGAGFSPPARREHAMAYLSEGLIIAFGGRDETVFSSATYGYDPTAENWTELDDGPQPSARIAHAMVAVGENKLIMFGGRTTQDAVGALDETWEYVGPLP